MLHWLKKELGPNLREALVQGDSVSKQGHYPGDKGVEVVSEVNEMEMHLELWLEKVEQPLH